MNSLKEEIVSYHIGIDLLGSDLPPEDLLQAVLKEVENLPRKASLILLGTPSLFESIPPPLPHITFLPVEEVISMEESPLVAIRKKRRSSLCTGIRLLKKKKLQALISAGNTGALLACAKFELPPLEPIARPALMTLLPTKTTEMAVLDVGANTSSQARHLIEFALMGVAYQKSRHLPCPRVGLLNIGSEAKKGTPERQQVYHELTRMSQRSSSFCFIGNIEGRDAFSGGVDVLITDGFTGNVFLKTAEGIAALILDEVNKLSPTERGVLSQLHTRLHYAEYPGAILAGIDGIILKCHGEGSAKSLIRSITAASRLIEHRFLDQIKEELSSLRPSSNTSK